MADEHQIPTTVDLRGLTQLSAAAQSAMGQVVAATLRVRAETKALKDAYVPLARLPWPGVTLLLLLLRSMKQRS
jgi:hypothetical protein